MEQEQQQCWHIEHSKQHTVADTRRLRWRVVEVALVVQRSCSNRAVAVVVVVVGEHGEVEEGAVVAAGTENERESENETVGVGW